MRGDRSLAVLQAVHNEGSVSAADLLWAVLSSGYRLSPGRLEYILAQQRKERARYERRHAFERRELVRYYNLISSLKRDNLIQEERNKGGKFLRITQEGKEKLLTLLHRKQHELPLLQHHFEKSETMLIVMFDIPETERKKRDWLRGALKNAGLAMIQKSVWIGKIKLPKEFLADLHQLQLTPFVEIFEVTKKGSLRHLA